MGTADFTVDAEAVDLLRFGTAAERLLSSGDIVLNDPKVDWAAVEATALVPRQLARSRRPINQEDQSRPIVIGFERFQEEVRICPKTRTCRRLEIFSGLAVKHERDPISWSSAWSDNAYDAVN